MSGHMHLQQLDLPLSELWILCSDDDVASGWEPCDVDGLLTKAEISEEQSDDEAVCVTNAC